MAIEITRSRAERERLALSGIVRVFGGPIDDLSEETGVTKKTIQAVTSGERKPQRDTIYKLLDGCGVTLEQFDYAVENLADTDNGLSAAFIVLMLWGGKEVQEYFLKTMDYVMEHPGHTDEEFFAAFPEFNDMLDKAFRRGAEIKKKEYKGI